MEILVVLALLVVMSFSGCAWSPKAHPFYVHCDTDIKNPCHIHAADSDTDVVVKWNLTTKQAAELSDKLNALVDQP